MAIKVEILYIQGCPHHPPAAERVRAVIREEGLAAEIAEIEVADECAALRLNFPGSPTIRVNGIDVDPLTPGASATGVACRRYPDGIPAAGRIQAALHAAANGLAPGTRRPESL